MEKKKYIPRQVPEDYEAKKLSYFGFRFEWQEDFEQLEDDATRWRLVDALLKYAKYGEVPTLEGLSLMAFRHMSQHIKAGLDSARKREYNQERNAERREARKQAKEADFVGEYKGEIENQIEIESKNKIESQNQIKTAIEIADGGGSAPAGDEDLDFSASDLTDKEKIADFMRYLLWRHGSDYTGDDMQISDNEINKGAEAVMDAIKGYFYWNYALGTSSYIKRKYWSRMYL